MTNAHDDPALAAARTFGADLPLLPGAGLRKKLYERDIDNLQHTRDQLIDALRETMRELESLYGAQHASVVRAKAVIVRARLTS